MHMYLFACVCVCLLYAMFVTHYEKFVFNPATLIIVIFTHTCKHMPDDAHTVSQRQTTITKRRNAQHTATTMPTNERQIVDGNKNRYLCRTFLVSLSQQLYLLWMNFHTNSSWCSVTARIWQHHYMHALVVMHGAHTSTGWSDCMVLRQCSAFGYTCCMYGECYVKGTCETKYGYGPILPLESMPSTIISNEYVMTNLHLPV